MGKMNRCEKCGDYSFSTDVLPHHCESFIIFDEDGEEHEIHASNEEDAALKYAERSNPENDYYLMEGPVVITINDNKYKIMAEPDIFYSTEKQ